MMQNETPNALATPDVAELQRLRALVAAQEEELFEWSATVQTVTAESAHRVQAVEAAAAAERRQFQAQIRSLQQEANLAHAAAAAAAEKTAEKAETIAAVSAGNTCRLLPENWNMRPTQGSPVKVEPSRMRSDGLPCEIHVPRTVEATTTMTTIGALECDELASILAWHLSQNTSANRLPPLVAAWQQTLATQSTSPHRADFILSHLAELCIMSSSRRGDDDNEEDCEESLILMQQLLLATRLVPPRLAVLLEPTTADGTKATVSRIRWRGSAVPPTPRPPPKSLSLAGWLPVLSAWLVPPAGATSALQRAVYASQVLDWLLDSTCTASAVWTHVSVSTWQCAWMQRAHDLLRHHGAQPRPLRLLNNVEVVVHDPVATLDAVWTEQWLAASLTTWSRLPPPEQDATVTRNIMAVVVDLWEHVVLPERRYQSLLLPCLQWCSTVNQQALYRTQFATDQSTPRRQWQRGPSLMAVLIRICHDLVLQEKATQVPFRNAIIRFWDGLVRSIQVERHAAEQDGRRVVPFLTFVSEQYDFYVAAAALLLSAPAGTTSPEIQTMLRVQMEELAHDEEERDEIVVAAQFPTKKRRTRR
jgi:hypothetical protein